MAKSTRVLEFQAALPLQHNPLRRLNLEGAEYLERLSKDETTMLGVITTYRNAVADLEEGLRSDLEAIDAQYIPDYPKHHREVDEQTKVVIELDDKINKLRQESRSREVIPTLEKQLESERKKLNKFKRACSKACRDYKLASEMDKKRHKIADPRTSEKNREIAREALEVLNEKFTTYDADKQQLCRTIADCIRRVEVGFNARYRELYHSSELYWGTKNLIRRAVKAARSATTTRHKGCDGQVSIGISFSPKQTWQRLCAHKTDIVHITPIPRDQIVKTEQRWVRRKDDWHQKELKTVTLYDGKNADNYYMLRFRIRDSADENLRYAEIPFINRPDRWPDDAIISGINVRRRRHGSTFIWRVQFVVEGTFKRKVGTGRVGVCFNLHKAKHGVCVGYYAGNDGDHGEILLNHTDFSNCWDRAEENLATADLATNDAKKQLKEWVDNNKRLMPVAMRKELRTLHVWRGRRLAEFVFTWRDNRFAGDTEIFAIMETWRKRNKRLISRFRNVSSRTDRRRDTFYKQFAAELRRKYGTVIVTDEDFAKRQRKVKTEDPDGDAKPLKTLYRRAAQGKLRSILETSSMACEYADAPTAYFTCSQCNTANDLASRGNDKCRCHNCGATLKRGYNAAMNLLQMPTTSMTKAQKRRKARLDAIRSEIAKTT